MEMEMLVDPQPEEPLQELKAALKGPRYVRMHTCMHGYVPRVEHSVRKSGELLLRSINALARDCSGFVCVYCAYVASRFATEFADFPL